MKRILFLNLLVLVLHGANTEILADETVRAAQTRLKAAGFYFAEVSGNYDDATAAAVSRYQIRNGLQITGELNESTLTSLGVTAAAGNTGKPRGAGDAWRQLRKSDREFLEKLDRGEIPPPTARDQTPVADAAPAAAEAAPAPSPPTGNATPATAQAGATPASPGAVAAAPPDLSGPPPNAIEEAETPAETRTQVVSEKITEVEVESDSYVAPTSPGLRRSEVRDYQFGVERLRDYVAAFVLAGLAPRVGTELEFFSDRTQYYDQGILTQEQIRRDLRRYNERWPERRFWLAGDLEVDQLENGRLQVSFPLRYELQRKGERLAGQVRKTLVLAPVSDDLEIVAVTERKLR